MRALLACVALALASLAAHAADPLGSWNEGPAKAAVVQFVKAATHSGGPGYIAPADRIAVFDNDGTLWSEQPMYFQLAFAIDRVRALAPGKPEWKTRQPFKAALEGDMAALAAAGEKGLAELVMATHAGTTPAEFEAVVKEWLATARHPRFKRPYTELVYQPMLELLAYLRANGFQTWIVSGGGVEFVRAFSEAVYGIPRHQVVGSSIKTRLVSRNGKPEVVRLPEIDFIDDKEGKPVGIQKFIGQRPAAAFGNSDGDLAMLQWTAAGEGPRFGLLVRHTDAEREYAYDRKSSFGRLDKALDEASSRGWTVVDMKRDWRVIYPPAR
jgi:phosphoserine phosphatase